MGIAWGCLAMSCPVQTNLRHKRADHTGHCRIVVILTFHLFCGNVLE